MIRNNLSLNLKIFDKCGVVFHTFKIMLSTEENGKMMFSMINETKIYLAICKVPRYFLFLTLSKNFRMIIPVQIIALLLKNDSNFKTI